MFGDPFQHEHMKSGIKAAAKSKKTPAHLKPHLEKRLKENSMYINPAHKGLFTKKANAAGKSVQQFADEKANAGGTLGKEANFARMAKRHFKPLPKNAKKSMPFDAFKGR
jgi:hypothetical protein